MTTPNILMLVVDQERCWDRTFTLVPEDRRAELWRQLPARRWLADNGVHFANHYASGIPCSPARSSIYTGFHAPDTQIINVMEFMLFQSLGVYDPGRPRDLGAAMPTLGDLLGRAPTPYHCAYKGKVHFALDRDLGDRAQMAHRYGFHEWTAHDTDYFDTALAGARHERDIALDAARWLTDRAPALGQPWLLAVNLINPHDIQYADIGQSLPPGLAHSALGLRPIPARDPYFNWWNPQKPANFGPAAISGPRPAAVDGFAGILSVAFGNIPFDDDALCAVAVGPDTVMQVPMWQAYLNYYINCILDTDADMWTVIQAFLHSGADLANTWIVYLSDHGEMAMSQAGLSAVYNGVKTVLPHKLLGAPIAPAMMPLRSKASIQFEEVTHVPLIFAAAPASGSVLPDAHRGTTVAALSSHVDLVPTLLALAGVPDDWYESTFGGYLQALPQRLLKHLPGVSLAPIVNDPSAYRERPGWSGRQRVLITGDALNTFDPMAAWAAIDGDTWSLRLDLNTRAMMRSMVAVDADGTSLVKFGRWFSAYDYEEQARRVGTYQTLTTADGAYLGQDVQVFRLSLDPFELVNVAPDLHDRQIVALSATLRDLMKTELSGPARTPNETEVFVRLAPPVKPGAPPVPA